MKIKGKLTYLYERYHGNYLITAIHEDDPSSVIDIALSSDMLLAESVVEALNKEESEANILLMTKDVDMSNLREQYLLDVMQIFSMHVTSSSDGLMFKSIYPYEEEYMSKDIVEKLLLEQEERLKNIH